MTARTVALLLPLLAVAAPVPKETSAQKLARWGAVVLGAHGDGVKLAGDTLVVRIPKGTRTFGPTETEKDATAPRTEHRLAGDFDLSVRVLEQTKTTPATEKVQAAVSSGLYVRSKDAGCLCYRSVGAMTSDPGAVADHVSFRVETADAAADTPPSLVSFGDPYGRGRVELLIRVTRTAGKLTVYHGCENSDGVVWRSADRQPTIKLADEVTVGVFVRQNIDQETTAEFADFKLERGAGRR